MRLAEISPRWASLSQSLQLERATWFAPEKSHFMSRCSRRALTFVRCAGINLLGDLTSRNLLNAQSRTENFKMSHRSTLPLVVCVTIASCGLAPRDAHAGPLLDWLFGRRAAPAYPVGTPVPIGSGYGAGYGNNYAAGYGGYPAGAAPTAGYAGNYGTYYSSLLPAIGPAGAGYTAPMPSGIAAATMPATMAPTLSYVPNFRTNAQRAPVTYYRPLLTTDPNTGAQVVAMAPCTSYEYMAQRVPVLGRSALFGSNAPPVFQPPSQALPTYTLPSGGVPLAYSAPAITSPYSTAYGVDGTSRGYGAYASPPSSAGAWSSMPSPTIAPSSIGPAGNYPTAPFGQSSYYGTASGGSCGGVSVGPPTPWQEVPGLTAPQAPATPPPNYQAPSFQAPSYPQATAPSPNNLAPPNNFAPPSTYAPVPGYALPPGAGVPSEIVPPSGFPGNSPPRSNDPADFQPQLQSYPLPGSSAQSTLRPQLRSITRQPQAGESPRVSSSGGDESDSSLRQLPTMLPIPAPDDFQHQPRWNPPLLRDGDMTAMRPIQPEVAQLAGQSKPIHWASFKTSDDNYSSIARSHTVELPQSTTSRLRPILSPALGNTGIEMAVEARVEVATVEAKLMTPRTQPTPTAVRPMSSNPRQTGGWKASR